MAKDPRSISASYSRQIPRLLRRTKFTRCSVCHGADLQGLGPVPGIAGRSPSYIARQMYDMQQGLRKGPWVSIMQPVVDKMTGDDVLNVTAYVSSLGAALKN